MNKSFTVFFLLFISTLSYSQVGRLRFADKQFSNYCFAEAASAYEDVLARNVDSATVAHKIALSYDHSGQEEQAVVWYRFLNANDMLTQDGVMRLALLERRMQRYPESDFLLELYSARYGKCDVCDNILSQKMNFEKLEKGKDNFTLQKEQMNTIHSELSSGFFMDDKFLVASSKRNAFAVKRIQSWTGDYYYDLYLSDITSEHHLGKMKRINGKVRSKFNEGTATYHQPTGYLYFTRNNFLKGKRYKGEDNQVNLSIYRAKFDGKRFKDVEYLGINSENYSTAHPAINKAGNRLYFSSNRPGGFGGMDLYYVPIDQAGNFVLTEITNLGAKVNTMVNEVFPFINSDVELLLFSSDGHFGYGGLDVYYTSLDSKGNARTVKNVGAPINSPYDDFSFVNNGQQTFGFFSSNRTMSMGSDDIFGFIQNKPLKQEGEVYGNAKNLLTSEPLALTMVYLKNKEGIIIDSVQTTSSGDYKLGLGNIDEDFVIWLNKSGYVPLEKSISFDPEVDDFQVDLAVMPVINYYIAGNIIEASSASPIEGVRVNIIEKTNGGKFKETQVSNNKGFFESSKLPYQYQDSVSYRLKLEKKGYISRSVDRVMQLGESDTVQMRISMVKIEVGKTDLNDIVKIEPIYFDLNSSYIRGDAKVELDKIVEVLKENPDIVIELGSHTDSRGDAKYNLWLSDRRAKSSAQYIISQGISKDRIYGRGYGKTQLKVTDAEINKVNSEELKEELHQRNRRTEFIIVKMK